MQGVSGTPGRSSCLPFHTFILFNKEINLLRENVFDLVRYLHKENILHALAHPLYAINDRLTVLHLEQMLLLFKNFENNGTRGGYQNGILIQILIQLTSLLKAPNRDLLLWVGHGTFLIRLNGEYWLTDPVFSYRAFWPKRKTPPGISLEHLKAVAPRLNEIISHIHYDHLDKETLLSLPEDTRIVVPLGLKSSVEGLNKRNVIHMDWWQRLDCEKDVRLVCLPMQHWSRRIGQGLNETLWASYMLMSPKRILYFGGDSGYFIGYKEIGKRYPGIDYALLPTTAYHPRWFMHYAHMNIDETLEAFNDLGARYMIPHQGGTFQLGDEPAGYPALDLKRTIARRGLDPSRFIILKIGEIYLLEDTPP